MTALATPVSRKAPSKEKPSQYRKRAKPGTDELLIWNIPEKVKMDFKIACIKKDVSMQEVLIEYMKKFIEKAG